jgi:hypothetical protein
MSFICLEAACFFESLNLSLLYIASLAMMRIGDGCQDHLQNRCLRSTSFPSQASSNLVSRSAFRVVFKRCEIMLG